MIKDVCEIMLVTVLLEGIITYFNEFFVSGKNPWQIILNLTLGIIVAVSYNIDLTKYMEIKSQIPYIGCALTGILISQGSNYIYKFVNKITSISKIINLK